ncbi:MAG TPA: hypothetical protein VF533_18990 [Solirubrobacteraceae bacterium]|jgi:hypothetical protein
MRLFLAFAVLFGLLPAAAQARCRPAGSETVTGSDQVRVYVRGASVVACHYATGRRVRLGMEGRAAFEREGYYGVDIVRAAGRYVAVMLRKPVLSPGLVSVDRLRLIDVKRAQAIDPGPVGCRVPDLGEHSIVVRGVVVTAAGTLAWGCYGGSGGVGVIEIHKFDRAGAATLDAQEPRYSEPDPLDFESVAISDARVYWRTRQGAHSAAVDAGEPPTVPAVMKPSRCRPRDATVVAGSGAVLVYVRRGSVVACHVRTGRHTRLGWWLDRDEGYAVRAVKVAGRHVAYVEHDPADSSQGPFVPDRLKLLDARRGLPVDIGRVGCDVPPDPSALATGLVVGSFDLIAGGRLAWGCYGGSGGNGLIEVHAFAHGTSTLLDASRTSDRTPISYDSVAVSPLRRVYWQHGSSARTAELR